jgi:hypothetical protein
LQHTQPLKLGHKQHLAPMLGQDMYAQLQQFLIEL